MQYDAVMVNIKTGEVNVMGSGHDLANAEAICSIAIAQRGVETHFYAPVPAGRYKDSDKWDGDGFARGGAA